MTDSRLSRATILPEPGLPDFIALSTFNGVALGYLKALKREMADAGIDPPVFIGGRLNQIPEASNTSLPVDVGDMLARLAEMAETSGEAPPA